MPPELGTAVQKNPEAGNTAKPAILIVEDEPGPRMAIEMVLRPFYSLYVVDKVSTALQVLKEQQIQLITLDLKLPDGEGKRVLQEVRQAHPDTAVIVITGYDELLTAEDRSHYQTFAILQKPFDPIQLLDVIYSSLIKRSQARSGTDAGASWC